MKRRAKKILICVMIILGAGWFGWLSVHSSYVGYDQQRGRYIRMNDSYLPEPWRNPIGLGGGIIVGVVLIGVYLKFFAEDE